MEELNITLQEHTFTNQKKCTTTQNKHKKTKARFSRLLRHPAWKLRVSIIFWFWRLINLSLRPTYLDSALALLVGQQEGHPARKKYGGMVEVGTG